MPISFSEKIVGNMDIDFFRFWNSRLYDII